jgi:CMP-N-acetylneuraminic acid synthetase
MSIYAVIPVKGTSERVLSKNFRPFVDGMSLTELKVKQTIESGAFADVFISSDSDEAEALAKKYGIGFIRRAAEYCNNRIPWSDVIHHVAESLPIGDDDYVCWSHTTSPLFDRFKEAAEALGEQRDYGFDGLVSVAPMNEYIVTEKGRPINYAWGAWHPYTQDVERLFRISGAVYMATKGDMVRYRYVLGLKPYLWQTSNYEAIDVDTDYDFKLAQLLYQHRADFAPQAATTH